MSLILTWAINASILFLLPNIVPALHVRGIGTVLAVATVIALFNAALRPALQWLSVPRTVLTLGACTLLLNGLLFWFAAQAIPGFQLDNLGWTIVAAGVYSLGSWAVNTLILNERQAALAVEQG